MPEHHHQGRSNTRLKQSNTALVYQLIDANDTISRVNIVQQSALAPASVTNITRELIQAGIVKELSQQASTGGRPAISLAANRSEWFFISCRLGRQILQTSIMDLSGKRYQLTEYTLSDHSAQGIVQALIQSITELKANTRQTPLIAVAITMAGLVDSKSGIVRYSPNHELQDFHLTQALASLSLPVFIGNDIRALALSEYYLGAATHCNDYLLISIHNGVGSGIVSGGQLLVGKHHTVGEIGHVQIDPFGKPCHCGNFGCLETVVSNQAIVGYAQDLIQHGHPTALSEYAALTIDDICHAANQGDAIATQAIQYAGRYLGQVLAMMVNVFNPEKLLFTGEIMAAEQILLPVIREQIQRQSLSRFAKEVTLCSAHFQTQSTIGGYALIKKALYDGPLLNTLLAAYTPGRAPRSAVN